MKPADRINFIKEISSNLSRYEWEDIDLVLGQFGLPIYTSWNGNSKKDYVIESVKNAKSGTLSDLRKYVLFGTSKEVSDAETIPDGKTWTANFFRLFISHVSEDKSFVGEIKQKLTAYGVDCFVAHEDINPTIEWQDVIEAALQSCDALTAFLTKNFHESNWTDQEIGFCVARRILVIPLKISINPYGFIGKFQAKNCSKMSSSEIAEEVFNILAESPLTSAKMSESIVSNFVASRSWESARARSLLLSRVKVWTPELLRKIEDSLTNHSHIPTAFGVPDRIKAILSKNHQ